MNQAIAAVVRSAIQRLFQGSINTLDGGTVDMSHSIDNRARAQARVIRPLRHATDLSIRALEQLRTGKRSPAQVEW